MRVVSIEVVDTNGDFAASLVPQSPSPLPIPKTSERGVHRIREVISIVFAQIHHRLTETVIKTGTGGLGKFLPGDGL